MNKTLKSIVRFKQVLGIEQQIQKEFMYEYLVDTPVSFFLFLFCSSAMLRNFIYIYIIYFVHSPCRVTPLHWCHASVAAKRQPAGRSPLLLRMRRADRRDVRFLLHVTTPSSWQQAPDRVTAPPLQKHDDSKRKGHEDWRSYAVYMQFLWTTGRRKGRGLNVLQIN